MWKSWKNLFCEGLQFTMSLAEIIIIGLLTINTLVGLFTVFIGWTVKFKKQDGGK